MSLIELALNRRVEWSKAGDTVDLYGDPSYAPPVLIRCRVSYKSRLVIGKDGDEIRSGAQVTTLAPVEIGDRISIDGREHVVIDVTKPSTLDGKEHRRKVYI